MPNKWQLATSWLPLTEPSSPLVRNVVQNKVIKVYRELYSVCTFLLLLLLYLVYGDGAAAAVVCVCVLFFSSPSSFFFINICCLVQLQIAFAHIFTHTTTTKPDCHSRAEPEEREKITDRLARGEWLFCCCFAWIGVCVSLVYRIIIRLRSTHNSQSFTINNNVNCRRCT